MNGYIYHSGVKGMKWGRRRWTNADGTLNAAGKERYGNSHEVKSKSPRTNNNLDKSKDVLNSSGNIARESGKIVDSISNLSRMPKIKKDYSKMTDQELRAKVNRLNMEKQYMELSTGDKTRGAYYIKSILDIVGSTAAIGASSVGIVLAIKQLKK